MKWLVPLGFLGLLSLVMLLIIYLLKPNYSQKTVSSTHIWRLSLMFLKKKKTINQITKLLILICQILIFCICAFILARPVLASAEDQPVERIVILDGSAAMLAGDEGETRFERAIAQITMLGYQTIEEEGLFSVIYAGESAKNLILRTNLPEDIDSGMTDLVCSYGSADIPAAMKLAEIILADNPDAEVIFYTSKEYRDSGEVTVKNISLPSDWNATVINFTADFVEGYYDFTAEVACYGKEMDLQVYLIVDGEDVANSLALCRADEPFTVKFSQVRLARFKSAEVYILPEDMFSYDDRFAISGEKETIRIQYATSYVQDQDPNATPHSSQFINGLLTAFANMKSLAAKWNIEVKRQNVNVIEYEGYDLYIIESMELSRLPTDGIVWLINPITLPSSSGLTIVDVITANNTLTAGSNESGLLKSVRVSNLKIKEHTKISSYGGYEAVMYCGNDPALLVKNENEQKITVLPFDLHNSTMAISADFTLLFLNLFNYYFPATLTDSILDVGTALDLNARAELLKLTGPEELEVDIKELPNQFIPSVPGLYTLVQELPLTKAVVIENFFVKVAALESNFNYVYEKLTTPLKFENEELLLDLNLIIYFASALAALLFLEWLLQSREQF